MKLYYSTSSPFVRKVTVAAIELGLDARIERILTNPWIKNTALLSDNPLSKVPTLVSDDGTVIFDSPVICEYLDQLAGTASLIPASGALRWEVLRIQALADGITDAAILRFLERGRDSAMRSLDFDSKQRAAVEGSLAYLEPLAGKWGARFDIGMIAVACALGYLDFRFNDEPWREQHPALAAWYERFALRPSMQATVPRPMPA